MSPASWTPSCLTPHPTPPSCHITGFGCPTSHIELTLVIIYFTSGNVYLSVLFSQIISPSPSSTESISFSLNSIKSSFVKYNTSVSVLNQFIRSCLWAATEVGDTREILKDLSMTKSMNSFPGWA